MKLRSVASVLFVSVLFSEPKIPQYEESARYAALRRRFQCSSASRKFLNSGIALFLINVFITFQCSSASRKFLNDTTHPYFDMPVPVSVLFSEPKIPQFQSLALILVAVAGFQCSSASRKFLNLNRTLVLLPCYIQFQCSSASRKFLNRTGTGSDDE